MPPEVPAARSRVRVSWTGNGPAERVKTIPITSKPGEKPAVVISFGPANNPDVSLPDLNPGDELLIGVELEVTTDLTPAQAKENAKTGGKPVGQPYDYAPAIAATLLLASDPEAKTARKGQAIQIGEPERIKLSHEQHHGLLVFTRTIRVPREGLPWKSGSRVNLILSADHPEARAGQVLLIGQNEFDGSVEIDMGAIAVVRTRPAGAGHAGPVAEHQAKLKALPLNDEQWRVVSSMRLNGLGADEQLLVQAQLKVSARSSGSAGRLKTRVFLADNPEQGEPDGKSYAARISSSAGHLTKANGSNCLPGDNERTFRKVGVVRMLKDAEQPLCLNLAAQAGNPEKSTEPGDLAIVSAELSAVRFDASTAG